MQQSLKSIFSGIAYAIFSLFVLQNCQFPAKTKGEPPLPEATPPPNYKQIFINQVQPISQMGNAQASVNVGRIEVKPNLVRAYVQITDTVSTLYSGAGDSKLKSIWCGLTDSISGKKVEIKNFTIKEVSEADAQPYALAIVIDHSGSMGKQRASVAQKAVADFIRTKRDEDAILLIKYDNKVNVEVALTKDKNALLAKLEPQTGLDGYGGYTSLIDATKEGINQLKDVQGYAGKAVVVFTDGVENGSTTPKDSLISFAKKNKIPICAFDFGTGIKEGFLESIATPTGGSYNHVYTTPEFNGVFQDIYKRLKNSYVIEFEPVTYGIHYLKLKICLPQGEFVAEGNYDNIPDLGDKALLNVYFDTNKWNLKTESKEALDNILTLMQRIPSLQIEVHGHTDDVGDADKNLELSQKRANSVKEYLIQEGINASRITAKGFGEAQPIADNKTIQGRAKNRRTEFMVVGR